jgi:hypothetical protein
MEDVSKNNVIKVKTTLSTASTTPVEDEASLS